MLHPRSVAVVGATPRLQYGGRFLAAMLKAKDRVRVYPVNPKYDELSGVDCYPTHRGAAGDSRPGGRHRAARAGDGRPGGLAIAKESVRQS